MAAVKRNERKFPQAQFDVPLADALDLLITTPGDIHPNATWHFHVDGATLVITRIDVPEDTPGNGPPAFAAAFNRSR